MKRIMRTLPLIVLAIGLTAVSSSVLAPSAAESSLARSTATASGTVDVDYTTDGAGYWITDADGGVLTYNAPHFGDGPTLLPSETVKSFAASASGNGYWLFTTTGRVIAYGDASFLGDLTTVANGKGVPISELLSEPIIGSAVTTTGNGYWLVASDGGIFSFGDAVFFGSMGGIPLNAPVVGLAPTSTGDGYWLVASDGGIFSFGDAVFFGSMGGIPLNAPTTDLIAQDSGYLMVARDGGIFSFGDSNFFGSLGGQSLTSPIVTATALDDLSGYLLVDNKGQLSSFGGAVVLPESTRSIDVPTTAPTTGAPTTTPTADTPATTPATIDEPVKPTKLVVHVSIDGLRPERITAARMPNLYRLMTEGASTLNARTDPSSTSTLPNHTSQFTGRAVEGPTGHGVTYNSDKGRTVHDEAGAYVASVFDVVHDNGGRTVAIVGKSKFDVIDRSWDENNGAPDVTGEDNGKDKIDAFSVLPIKDAIAAATAELSSPDLEYLFFHIKSPDAAGHADGWNSSEYDTTLTQTDANLGTLIDSVRQDAQLAEATSFIIVADHGGTKEKKSHSDPTGVGNYTIPLIVWGPAVAPGADLYQLNPNNRSDPGTNQPGLSGVQPIREHEIGNLALDLLGYGSIPGSTFNSGQDLKVS